MNSWILFGILAIIDFTAAGQRTQTDYSPFQILIIHSDSAEIDALLGPFADSIEKRHIDRYYGSIRSLEILKENLTEEQKVEIDTQIRGIKLREMDAYNFRYYYTISDFILFDLEILFNPTYWEKDFLSKEKTLIGEAIKPSQLFSRDLNKLSKYYQVDYILKLEDVHTENLADTISSITLKFKATLYSSKNDKIVLEEVFSGNSPLNNYKYLTEIYSSRNKNERPLEKRVRCDNYLDCLFKSSTRYATEKIYDVISRIQKK